jgi:hypothetical protein
MVILDRALLRRMGTLQLKTQTLGRPLQFHSVKRRFASEVVEVAEFYRPGFIAVFQVAHSIFFRDVIAGCRAISSTNAGLAAFRLRLGTPPRRFFSPTWPAAVGARRNTRRVANPVRSQPATATPAASSAAATCCETAPTGVATVRLAREWVCFLLVHYQPPLGD